MSITNEVIIPDSVKAYYAAHKDEDQFDFSQLERKVSTVGRRTITEYSLVKWPNLRALAGRFFSSNTSHLRGGAVVPFLESDLQAKLKKVREGLFGRAVRTLIRSGITKGADREGARILDGHYWVEAIYPRHHTISMLLHHFWTSSDTKLSFANWVKAKDLSDEQLQAIKATSEDRASSDAAYRQASLILKDEEISQIADEKMRDSNSDTCELTEADFAHLSIEKYKVAYLSPSQREAFRIAIEPGANILKNRDGQPMVGAFAFVMGHDQSIFANVHEVSRFHHSSFLSGQTVMAAGEFMTNEAGEITEITNKSGHYKPTTKQMFALLVRLESLGVDLSKIRLRLMGSVDTTFEAASEFVKYYRDILQAKEEGIELSRIRIGLGDGSSIPAAIFLGE